jgi:transcriptional regulator with XRE-family HTH domain
MTTTPVEHENSLNSQVAGEIRAWMGRREMNQADLGRALGENEMWVMRRVRGRQQMTVTDLQRIARVLDITVLELFPPSGGATTTRSATADFNPRLSQPARKDDPKPVRHVTTRPFGPPRRDPNHPVSAVPLSTRRPRDTRPVKRPMAVAS